MNLARPDYCPDPIFTEETLGLCQYRTWLYHNHKEGGLIYAGPDNNCADPEPLRSDPRSDIRRDRCTRRPVYDSVTAVHTGKYLVQI